MAELTFTGERFLPGCTGEIAYEHWHRYAFARRFVAGKRVLDAACGEGYGTMLLGAVAQSVLGVDVDVATINHAKAAYGETVHRRFIAASCAGMPLPSASIDVIVSFETIEHVDAVEQRQMMGEFARVLKPDGLLIMSSPNKRLYSEARNYVNPYHVNELDREGFARLLMPRFPAQRWLHQRLAYWSTIWSEGETAGETEAWLGSASEIRPYATPEAMYFIVVAARAKEALPAIGLKVSLFTDAEESAVRRAEADAHEALRLDELLKERDLALAERNELLQHMHAVAEERRQLVVDREAQIAEIQKVREDRELIVAERERQLAAAIDDRDRRIADLDH